MKIKGLRKAMSNNTHISNIIKLHNAPCSACWCMYGSIILRINYSNTKCHRVNVLETLISKINEHPQISSHSHLRTIHPICTKFSHLDLRYNNILKELMKHYKIWTLKNIFFKVKITQKLLIQSSKKLRMHTASHTPQ